MFFNDEISESECKKKKNPFENCIKGHPNYLLLSPSLLSLLDNRPMNLRDEGWGKGNTLTRQAAQEDSRLVPQNNHLSGVSMQILLQRTRKKAMRDKPKGKIEREAKWRVFSFGHLQGNDLPLEEVC